MKKFTLSFIASLLAVFSASAQNDPKPIQAFNPKTVARTMQQLPGERPAAARIARAADASTILFEQPEGTLYDQVVASYGGYGRNWLYGIMDISTDGGMSQIVEGVDGNVYIYNLPTYLQAGSWVKAERAEGDTIVIHRQLIDQREGNGNVYDYYITKLVWEWTDQEAGEGRLVEAQGDTDIKLLYKDGKVLSIEENIDPFVEGHYALGAVYTTDGETFTWEGSANWNLNFEVLTDGLIELPENATLETITVSYTDTRGNPTAEQVPVAFVGNEVYLNVYSDGVYVKGTIEGDKLTFKSGQFLGDYYNMYYLFFVGEHYYTYHDDATDQDLTAAELLDELVFDYDAEKRSFSTDEAFVINVGKNTTRLYLTALLAPKFYFFEEVPATPADPVITNYNATMADYGYNALQFNIVATDADGGFIVPEKISWQAYIDDEPFIFTPDDYESLTEEMEEIPYGFYDSSYDIYLSFYTIYFEPAKNVGIQTIYRGAGVERRSNIVYFDLATSQIVKEPWNNPETGISSTGTAATQTVNFFDAAGRKVNADAKGLIIKQVTLADGTQKTVKLIRK
ncbi:MAG: hypothetical protein IJ570_07675 [Prevotella sp.]|nr:hypothetical protein [Prevotella sp.]